MSKLRLTIGNLDISDFVQSAIVSGDIEKFNRVLEVSLLSTADGRTPVYNIELGASVNFYVDEALHFVGVVFYVDRDTVGNLSITVYDPNIYLAKSYDSQIYKKKKASEITRMLAMDFGVPIGDIADTGFVIPYLRMDSRTLREHIAAALTITRKQTGKRFVVRNDKGKLTLVQGTDPKNIFVFKSGQNIISAQYSQSIEDTVTQVKVIGGAKGKETVVTAKDDAARKKYGVLQVVETMDEKATASQVKQRASTLLKENGKVSEEIRIEVLGVPEVISGSLIRVNEEMTGASGNYYVIEDKHTFDGGLHTMSLLLSRTNEVADVESDNETN